MSVQRRETNGSVAWRARVNLEPAQNYGASSAEARKGPHPSV